MFERILARFRRAPVPPPRDGAPCHCGSRYHGYRFETTATFRDGVAVNKHYDKCGKCGHKWPRVV